jgi:hypothetical protein
VQRVDAVPGHLERQQRIALFENEPGLLGNQFPLGDREPPDLGRAEEISERNSLGHDSA